MIPELLDAWCTEHHLSLTADQQAAFQTYADLLVDWNQHINLTAITDPKEIAVKHFIDSLSVLTCTDLEEGASLIDIGTGAGFPGLPLKIMRPDLHLTLLDSLNKRLIFLEEVCRSLSLKVNLVHARAEEYGQKPAYREQYDYVVSRAVANLPALCEYCTPYLKVGGKFIAMKGPDGETELQAAANALRLLNCCVHHITSLTLPDESIRIILSLQKQAPTPSRYPRRGVKIAKSPL